MKFLLFYIGYIYYLILVKTSKIRLIGFDQVQDIWKHGRNVVFCCPHNAILACFVGVDSVVRPNVVLISSLSHDGELVAKLLIKRKFEMIRGSSNRGGVKGLFELKKAGKLGKSLGIAFDGPKGPPLVPKRGLIGCARAVDGPLIFIHAHVFKGRIFGYPKAIRVKSWDRFLIPLPFSEITVHFEKLPEKEETNIQDDVQYENFLLDKIHKRASEIYSNIYK